MKFDFYKHSRTGKVIKVTTGLNVGGYWVKIAENVNGDWEEEGNEELVLKTNINKVTLTVEDLFSDEEKEKEEETIEEKFSKETHSSLDWLDDGLDSFDDIVREQEYSSYHVLISKADRGKNAFVGDQEYSFNGSRWVKV